MNPSDAAAWPSRILVVDDEEPILALYRRLLSETQDSDAERECQQMGRALLEGEDSRSPAPGLYSVTCCSQGDEAVEAVRLAVSEGQPYAVAFVDMRMPPGPDGLETGRQIRALDPELQIVFCTAYSDVDPAVIAQHIPPPDRLFYAQKPLHSHELHQFASALSARWRAECEARLAWSELSDSREQLREVARLESVGRLAGGVAHGFNNILAMVMGFLELAQRDVDPQSRPGQHLARALRAAADGARLTDRLLSVGRRQRLRLDTVDLNAVVSDMAESIAHALASSVHLVLALDPTAPVVSADAQQLRDVILNLATNARDAMPDGGELRISTSVMGTDAPVDETDERPTIVLEVADTGCGMDAATARRAFEPFFTTKPVGRGSGLGLAACHGIIQQHGGEMQLETVPGAGTRVRILLHRAVPGVPAANTREDAGQLPRGTERILLVEDMSDLRVAIREMLDQLGYDVSAVGGAAEAMALVTEGGRPFDLMVTDVVMPETDGLELCRRVREVSPQTRVLFMSGFADLAQRDAWPLLNATNFLPKPFTVAQLAHRIRDALS